MDGRRIVIDTCVLVSALRSRRGVSHRLLRLLGGDKFTTCLSVSLLLEYEEVSKRLIGEIPLTEQDVDDVLDYVCGVAERQAVFYLWRPFLKDANDDRVLELAVAAGCEAIITWNVRDFAGAEQFGIRVRTPRAFLQDIGELL